jgi:glyoxylate utilization-related uncharacterized protein
VEPGSISALRHWHEAEDEFVYVLSGELTLVDDNGEHALTEGSFAGFAAGCQSKSGPTRSVSSAMKPSSETTAPITVFPISISFHLSD